jgi:rRNA maturation endonuclease Nob1
MDRGGASIQLIVMVLVLCFDDFKVFNVLLKMNLQTKGGRIRRTGVQTVRLAVRV